MSNLLYLLMYSVINSLLSDKPCEATSITGVVRVDGNDATITFSTIDSKVEFQCKLDNEILSPCKFTNVPIRLFICPINKYTTK